MPSFEISSLSLVRSILFSRIRWRILILFISLISACLGLLAPFAQKKFSENIYLGSPSLIWVFAAFALAISSQGLGQLAIWIATRESLITQKSVADKSFKRMLEGPGGLIGRKPAGEAISLFAVDIPGAGALLDQTLVMSGSMMFPLLLTPIALHISYEIPLWVSSLVLCGLALINFLLAHRQSFFFYSFKQLAAERTGLVAEWIQNIRTLRILGWMEAIESRMFRVRQRETQNRLGMVTNGQIMNAIASSSTFAFNVLAILFLVNFRNKNAAAPTAAELLSLLWVLGVFLARPLRQFPWTIVMTLDALTSIRRLEQALQIPIVPPVVARTELIKSTHSERQYALEIQGLNLEIEGQNLLEDINLTIPSGSLVAIVGEVGSGKSLLLQSLIGATAAKFSTFMLNGQTTTGPLDPQVRSQIAYVPQEGFTMSAALRENVMFSYLKSSPTKDLDDGVLESLRLAQFTPEQERVAEGLNTEIGERGVNLSGGQRQRISLARAHYASRPIILIDDGLSAVDVRTESQLIENLICGAWKNCTRLLVTHRMAILPQCDTILFMGSGRVLYQGTFKELYQTVPHFRDFLERTEKKDPNA